MLRNNEYVVVVPTYDNPKTIQKVVDDIISFGKKVIVVDDGSKVRVDSIIKQDENITILTHEKNMGKGAAIITAANEAKKLGYDYIVTLDGDGQHLASEIEKLTKVCDKNEEIIIGARDLNISNVPLGSKIGKWFSNYWASLDCGVKITDSLSGFRLYPVSITELNISTFRYDWEMEVIVRHAWKDKEIKEVNIDCYYPLTEERVSHFKKFWDTINIALVHSRLIPLKFFLDERNR